MFVHHVFFWLKNANSSEDRNQLEKGLLSLEKIDVIRTFHVGVPASTNRPVIERSYSFSLLLIFDDLEEQETYQTHPIHERFVKENAHLWSKVVVYDSVEG